MRLYTSSFWVCGRSPRAIAISRQSPSFFTGRKHLKLAPSWAMLQRYKGRVREAGVQAANAAFNLEYEKLLGRLDAQQVASELGNASILCCWERDPDNPETPCHRTVLAEWLRAAGIEVVEIKPKAKADDLQLDLF